MSKPLLSLAAITVASALLSGCATGRILPSAAGPSSAQLSGRVKGGQQPVAGASIQLFAAGSAGNGSASTPLLTSTVLTDANGAFSITGDYTCPSASTQVYIAATGGNPGLPGTAVNPDIALVTALGPCGALTPSTYLAINEVTTVAAAWSLAPFAASISSIGASATNSAGLGNAMATAALLADTATGASPAASLPANASVESAKLYTLANLLAACVNSDGTSLCPSLFNDATPSGATAPADTFGLALAIASNPAYNVAALFNDLPAQNPFPASLTAAPNDWTLSIAYTGGGMNGPAAVSVDGNGSVWVASNAGTGVLSAFTPQGTPVFQSGIMGTGLDSSISLTIDTSSNLWIANMASNAPGATAGSVSILSPSGASLSGPNGIMAGGINQPVAAVASASGTVWIANYGASTLTELASDGTPLSGPHHGYGLGMLSSPIALAVDASGNPWVVNQATSVVTSMDTSGNLLHQTQISGAPDSVAFDTAGHLWVGDNTNSLLSEIDTDGSMLAAGVSGGGINRPSSLTIDAGNRIWVTDNNNNAISELAANHAAGQTLSPASGLGMSAQLHQPGSSAVDASGNLWVTSAGDNRLIQFVGLAVPTRTPKLGFPQQP